MKPKEPEELIAKYTEYLGDSTVKTMILKLSLGLLILTYFSYTDLVVIGNVNAFYTRLLSITLGILLIIFHFLFKNRFKQIKLSVYNYFLASLALMMLAKCLVHLNDAYLASSVAGTLLIYFIISLEIKSNTKKAALIYFVPVLVFILILVKWFHLSNEQFDILSNIYPISIIGFLINRIQNRLRFGTFQSNYLLDIEKVKAGNLYNESLITNKKLNQSYEEILAQHDEIELQRNQLYQTNTHITNSINYARNIQNAMLPAEDIFLQNFSEYLILYKPSEILSGDFYWIEKNENSIIYAVADCTGHGVPGAMLSMLGISLLNKITSQNRDLTSAEILEKLRCELKKSLNQKDYSNTESKDGMDISVCKIDTDNLQLQFSGAYNSLYIYRDKELIELKADRQPIAIYIKEENFTNHIFQLQKGDILYAFTDGFVDQFDENENKYKIKRFKKFILDVADFDLHQQKQLFETEFLSWKLSQEQTDDVTVVAVKI